jgi:hypothetical protein
MTKNRESKEKKTNKIERYEKGRRKRKEKAHAETEKRKCKLKGENV